MFWGGDSPHDGETTTWARWPVYSLLREESLLEEIKFLPVRGNIDDIIATNGVFFDLLKIVYKLKTIN